ncbi:MAG TPA: TonB-dependent receptor [Vicinamibacterales bacterium]|nr:TonB-dependent receptor [Vicinamibacterales bacterium]
MRRCVLERGLWLLVLLAVAAPARAQRTTGEIFGTVTDQSNAVLPGVTVTIRGAAIGGAPTVVTSETGVYRFPALPPGDYVLEYVLSGFSTIRREGITVGVGAVVDLKVQMTVSTLNETVTVTGESPVVNIASTTVSTNYNKQWVEAAPIRHFSFFDLVNSAPGVSATSTVGSTTTATTLGSSINDNIYEIDGTDLSSPIAGTAWPWPNADAIQEIEVLQLGASAEYGNVMGAVFNVVTRAGTNEFHGDGNYYSQYQGVTGRNTTISQECAIATSCPAAGLPYHRDQFQDTTWQAAGPLMRDKFWFFGSFEYQNDYDSQPGTDPNVPIKSTSRRVFYKFTYNINENHRLMHGYHDDYWSFPAVPAANQAPTTVSIGHGDNPTPNFVYTGVLSSKTFVEARLAGYYGKDSTDPLQSGEPRVLPRVLNNDTGQITGGISSWNDEKVWRTGISGKVSHLADRFMGGSHDLKLGVQYSGGGQDTVTGPNDYIYLVGGKPSYGYTRQPWHAGGLTRQIGVYVDDTYRLGNAVTFNLGLRFDHSKAEYPSFPVLDANGNPTGQSSPGNSDVYHWNVISPRVGVTWKVNQSGKTIAKAYYGKLYRGILLGDFTAAIPSLTPKYDFSIDPVTGQRTNFVVASSSSDLAIDHGYKDPYSHEVIAQLEQEVMANLGLQVNYVHKQGYDYPGWQDITGQYAQVPYVDNVGPGATGNTVMVDKLLTPYAQTIYQMTNAPGLYSKYNGVTVTGTKRMSNNWQGTMSLVLSKSEGREPSSILGPGSAQSGTSGGFGRFACGSACYGGINDYINSDGLLIADRPVVAKAQLIYRLPWNLLVSGNLQHQTGRPWARQIRVGGLGFPTKPTIYMTPLDGSERLPSLDLIDARLQKSIALSRGTNLQVFFDALNLTNSDTNENVLARRGDLGPSFGVPSKFVYPRRLQLGAKIVF